jgi:hypothetical protein
LGSRSRRATRGCCKTFIRIASGLHSFNQKILSSPNPTTAECMSAHVCPNWAVCGGRVEVKWSVDCFLTSIVKVLEADGGARRINWRGRRDCGAAAGAMAFGRTLDV